MGSAQLLKPPRMTVAEHRALGWTLHEINEALVPAWVDIVKATGKKSLASRQAAKAIRAVERLREELEQFFMEEHSVRELPDDHILIYYPGPVRHPGFEPIQVLGGEKFTGDES